MKKLFKKTIKWLFIIALICAGAIWALGYREYQAVLKETSLESKVATLHEENGYATYDTIPQLFLDAVVSVEDERYWTRTTTLDYEALGRAMVVNVMHFSLEQGGSTIPQQVAKNLYFDHSASLVRKVSEYYITKELLDDYSKYDILEMYVNIIYYGNSGYGIKNASQIYFDVDPWQLNEGELIILAGLPQAPSVYDLTINFNLAKERQAHVLSRMVSNEIIDQDRADAIYAMEVRIYEEND